MLAHDSTARGIEQLVDRTTAFFIILFLMIWGGFISSLYQPTGGRKRLVVVVLLHFSPLPGVMITGGDAFWPILAFSSLGGLALILGVPRRWPPEERARVRRRTIIGVIAGFTALAIFGLCRGT